MKKKAELNLIDKAIAFVNPQGAVDRLVARQKLKNFEYDAVKYSRERKGPSSLSGAEDYRSNYDRVELMKRVQIDQTLRQELLTKRKKLEGESEERILKKFPKAVKNLLSSICI